MKPMVTLLTGVGAGGPPLPVHLADLEEESEQDHPDEHERDGQPLPPDLKLLQRSDPRPLRRHRHFLTLVRSLDQALRRAGMVGRGRTVFKGRGGPHAFRPL